MSVYPRKGSPYFYFEFEINGARFRGSTKKTSRREAERVEARERARVEARIASGAPAETLVQMTLGDACARFWTEKAQHEANSASVWYQLENLVDGLGKSTPLSAISMSDLAEYQARRRGQKNRFGRFNANRTVNAEVPELLARIYARAGSAWSGEASRIDLGAPRQWADLKLRTPKGRIRELRGDEETRLFEKLRTDYAPIVEFALASGLRRAALILRWDQVDLDAGVIRYARKSLHENDIGVLPITDRIRQIIIGEKGRSKTWVFTYVAHRTRDGRKQGRRYPITGEGFKTEMRRAVKAAKLQDWRLIHDLRHTAATRTLRASGNMKAVQAMLGHADIASTARYAHVMLEDVRAAMDAAAPRKTPAIVENKPKRANAKR